MWRSEDESWRDIEAFPADDKYGTNNFRSQMLQAWHELDWLFDGVDKGDVEVLNLDTDKLSGFEWSGVVTPNGVAILASYLGNRSGTWFDVPEIEGYEGILDDRIWVSANMSYRLITAEAVPEPLSIGMLGAGAAALLRKRRRCSRR